jgi:hypothetical protein
MTTFTWKIVALKVAEDNLVVKVDLVVKGDNGKQAASVACTRDLVRGDTFTPYEQLTEQQVLDWCFEPQTITWVNLENTEQSVIKLLKVEGEARVTEQIERQSAKKVSETALPWAT